MHRCARSTAFLIPLLSLLALAPVHEAAALTTSCVNTPALLQSKLTTAQTNNDDNYIKVVTGSYSLTAPVDVRIPTGHALTVEGGYTGCNSAPTATAYNTTILGGSGVYLKILVGDGTLTVRNLTLSGLKPPAGTQAISLYQNGYGGTLHVENVNVTGNTVASATDDILFVQSLGGLVFDDNIVHDNPNAFYAAHISGNNPALPFVVANNTVVNNVGYGLYFDVQSFLPSGLYNNILWHNGTEDLTVNGLLGDTAPLALNNTWLTCNGCGGGGLASASANNSTADPVLTSNYQPGNGSPVVNAGIPLPLALPATDIQGNQRVVGSAPDEGAFESIADDLAAHTYVVPNNGDDAANTATLRGAITDANSKGVPARIKFDSSVNGCPMEIDLATPLPAITVPMVIDGYDANSAVNSAAKFGSSIPFNATLCTLIFNTSAAGSSAFTVAASAPASQHLEVRSLRFANFSSAVNLAGGNGHWIHGNAFAAASLGVVGNNIGVSISGGQADVIGGPATADVNLIGASSGAAGTGVLIQGAGGFHTVINNNIGGDPAADSSSTAYGNSQNGVWLLNATRDNITGNMIEFSGVNGIVLNHASYSAITGNLIAFGGDVSGSFSGDVPGVRLSNGSANNWIGATAGLGNFADAVANAIVANSGPGVWIDPTASYNNQVVANVIALNQGLSIDLAAQGPTANAGNESSGPNFMLHKPVIASALDTGGGTMQVTGTIPTEAIGTGRLLTLYANQNCGGDAETLLGTFSVSSGSDSMAHFTVTVPKTASPLVFINATEEGPYTGPTDTSEISNTRMIKPKDDIFYDGFDCY